MEPYSNGLAGINSARMNQPIDPPRAVGDIENNVAHIDSALTRAHERLDAMTRRLEGVLRIGPPAGVGASKDSARPVSSPLGEKLRGQALAIDAMADRLNDLFERIDI